MALSWRLLQRSDDQMSSTLDYYNANAGDYVRKNHSLEAPIARARTFAQTLLAGAWPGNTVRVLDAGSGSGRDTLVFMEAGLDVDAFDGSEAMAKASTALTGKETRVMRFEDLKLPEDHYDGIWAMASLLHVQREDLPRVMSTLGAALKPGGLLVAGFKHGTQERLDPRQGRRFTDMTDGTVADLIEQIGGFEFVESRVDTPPETQTNQEPWYLVTLRRTAPTPRAKPRPTR